LNTFGRRVGVEFFGDATSLEKSFANVAVATKEYGTLSVATSKEVADARVLGTAKSIKALRADIETFTAASTSYVKGSDLQIAATIRLAAAQKRLAAVTGETVVATAGTGRAAKTAERDLGKTTRGLIAGSGAAAGLGRSLAFASGGFLAVASGAGLIRSSITGAEDLAKAQESLAVAIRHTGGNLAVLGPRYAAIAKGAAEFGVSQADATRGLARATVLTGGAAKAQRAYQEALVISKATGKDFNAVLTATSKGQEGVTTSLRRYGILVKTGSSGTEQFTQVMERFGGQAEANTTVSEKFRAALSNTEAIIGRQLLPTFEHLTSSLTAWLTKMSESGRLQKDVADTTHVVTDAFKVFGAVIGTVDKVTGSFKNTLEALVAVFAVRKIFAFGDALVGLAAKWGLVTTAATEAAAAETAAGAAGGVGAAATIGEGAAIAGGAGIALSAPVVGEAAALGFVAFKGLTSGTGPSQRVPGGQQRVIVAGVGPMVKQNGKWYRVGRGVQIPASPDQAAAAEAALGGRGFGPQFRAPSTGADSPNRGGLASPPVVRTAAATPIAVYSKYTQTISEQLATAQAGLTKTTQDDVAAAKAIIARIKRLIGQGHLKGQALLQALQDEATQQGVLDSARQAAAQQAAQLAAAKKATASSYTTPIDIQLAQARAELTASSADDIKAAKAALAAAKAAVASGKKNKQGQLAAIQGEVQAKQTLDSLRQQSSTAYTVPAKLSLALAKAQATGQNITPVLLKMKAALEKALKAAKGNIQKQTDIYNQIYGINQQIGQGVASALGGFKQASTKALTAGLGLTPEQRRALRGRLSQLGPHGTVPGSGVGAAGFVIGTDGRPLVVHTHVNIDGKRVADNTTRHQQRHRRRNPSQRRGPNAGIG
jgi:hypothetical protein